MKKGILFCSGGFSSTAVAQALDDCSIVDGLKWEATGINSFSEEMIEDYDYVLVSPQIRYQELAIRRACEATGKKFLLIKPELYNAVRVTELYDEIKRL